MKLKFLLIISLSVFVASCSVTPGDAAYRAGQSFAAADLYRQGADQGDATAALKLGLMIEGRLVSIDRYGNALNWYLRACKLGDNAGCHNSGNGYEYGKSGARKNINSAKKYYTIAAKKGYMQSQYNLGTLYSNKYFHDNIEGLKWMLLAENTARRCSRKPFCQWVLKDPPGHRAKLMGRMSRSEIEESKRRAGAVTGSID